MNVIRFSTPSSQSRRRIVAGAVTLALSLVASPLLAEQPGAVCGPAQTTQQRQSPQNNESQDASPSRINGRVDWDVDYPSQLAPQAFRTTRATGAASAVTPAVCSNIDGCAP
jgi:hypothetical protein